MRIIRRTNITVKTVRNFVVQSNAVSEKFICDNCNEVMLSVMTSVDFFGFSSRIIYRLIESGNVHFFETDDKKIYVCPASIRIALKIISA